MVEKSTCCRLLDCIIFTIALHMKQCSLELTEETELATKICIANNIIRNKKQKKDTKIYYCVLSEEKGFGKQYDLQA